jgi:hypothetical protein
MYCTWKAKQKGKLYSKQEPIKIAVFVRQYSGMLCGLDTYPGFMSVTQKWPLPELGRRKLRGNILYCALPHPVPRIYLFHTIHPPPPLASQSSFQRMWNHASTCYATPPNTLSSRGIVVIDVSFKAKERWAYGTKKKVTKSWWAWQTQKRSPWVWGGGGIANH